jgi:hypothetical protein
MLAVIHPGHIVRYPCRRHVRAVPRPVHRAAVQHPRVAQDGGEPESEESQEGAAHVMNIPAERETRNEEFDVKRVMRPILLGTPSYRFVTVI